MKNTFLLFVLLFIFWSCNKKVEHDEVIRPVFNIMSSDLMPYVEGMDQHHSVYNASSIDLVKMNDSIVAVEYSCFWDDFNSEKYVRIKLFITEGDLIANKLFIERSNSMINLDGTALNVDEVAVAGELSYGNGQLFKRENIIVEISGIMHIPIDVQEVDPSISKIAKLVDDKILQTEEFYSVEEIKPNIVDMSFSGSPEKLNFSLSVEPEEDLQAVIYRANGKKIEVSSLTAGYALADSSVVFEDMEEDEIQVFAISKYGFCSFKKFSTTSTN